MHAQPFPQGADRDDRGRGARARSGCVRQRFHGHPVVPRRRGRSPCSSPRRAAARSSPPWRQAGARCTWPSSGATRSISARRRTRGRRGRTRRSSPRRPSCRSPSLSSPSGPTLNLAYARGNNLYYRRSTDRGSTWSRETLISKGLGNHFYRLSLDVSGTKVHLAWVQHDRNTFATTSLYLPPLARRGPPLAADEGPRSGGEPARAPGALGARHATFTSRGPTSGTRTRPATRIRPAPRSTTSTRETTAPPGRVDRRMTFGHGATIGRPDVLAFPDGAVSLVWQNDLKQRGTGGDLLHLLARRREDVGEDAAADVHPARVRAPGDRRVRHDRAPRLVRPPSAGHPERVRPPLDERRKDVERGGADHRQRPVNAAAQVAVTANFAHAVWPVNDDYIEYSRRPRPHAALR